jgi:hypothetical protein
MRMHPHAFEAMRLELELIKEALTQAQPAIMSFLQGAKRAKKFVPARQTASQVMAGTSPVRAPAMPSPMQMAQRILKAQPQLQSKIAPLAEDIGFREGPAAALSMRYTTGRTTQQHLRHLQEQSGAVGWKALEPKIEAQSAVRQGLTPPSAPAARPSLSRASWQGSGTPQGVTSRTPPTTVAGQSTGVAPQVTPKWSTPPPRAAYTPKTQFDLPAHLRPYKDIRLPMPAAG